ncbi:MAG: BTAD domain-containing putative transcriptional regulator [Gemmatimonadaceae bacterium]|jgi:DNA-binding SARP family transcriptional activator
MFTLRLLGGFALLDASGAPLKSLSQRRAEAVLALLALSGDLGCTRDRLVSLLWPEADESHARHNLRSALLATRHAVDQEVVVSTGDIVRLNAALVDSDVGRFTHALAAERLATAVDAYGGSLLDGFHLDEAPEFERYIEEERARLYRKCAEALEALAKCAESAEDWRAAVIWRQRAVGHDPHNSRQVILLMRAMSKEGDPANALLQAELHRNRLWKDLEIEPDTEVMAEAARIRQERANHGGAATQPVARVSPPTVRRAADAESAPRHDRAPATAPEPALAQSPMPSRRGRHGVLAAAVGLIAAAAAGAWWWTHQAPVPLDSDRVAVVPFAWGDHPQYKTEAREFRATIVRELLDGPAPNAVEPVRVDRAWTEARGADETSVALTVDADVAARTGASLVLRGAIDSTTEGRLLSLTLSRFPAQRVIARRELLLGTGDPAFVARRLLLEVLALEADQPLHRLPELARHPAAAVRIFLAGVRRTAAGGCRPMLDAVWKIDSTLVYPGLACLWSGGYAIGGPSFRDTVARVVWQHRGALTREDAAFTNALVGPWFGLADNAEQRIALWDVAAHAAPDWWVPWQVLARELVNFGPRTTIMDWRRRARLANNRALALCGWSQEGPVGMAFWFGVFEGDSARSRVALEASRRFETMEPQRPFTNTVYYWFSYKLWPALYDAAFGNGETARRLRPEPATPGRLPRSLMTLAIARPSTAIYADSLLVRWEQTKQGQGIDLGNYFAASWWQIRGDYARYRERYRHYLAPGARSESPEYDDIAENVHTFIWEVMVRGAPEDSLFRHVVAGMQRVASGDSVPAPRLGVRGVASCWVSQWRMFHGDTTGVAAAIALLRTLEAKDRRGELDGLPGSGQWVECPALLEAQRARLLKRGALKAARAYDALVRPLPLPRRHWWSFTGNGSHDGVRIYNENLEVARLLADAGDTAAALAAVRRRTRHDAMMADFYQTPTQHLRLEGRLAAAMLDTAGAITAYETYLALRERRPEHPPWRAEWDSVKAELARMKKPRP